MAALTRPGRTAAGIAFLAGGALVLLGLLLGLAGIAGALVFALVANLPIAAGFGVLAFGVRALPARIALAVAAIGFLLTVLATILWVPALGTVGVLAAAVGGVVAAALVLTGGVVARWAAIALLVATIADALTVLPGLVGLGVGPLVPVLTVVFGAGLVVAGVFILRVPRGR
jgi:hypothetical protein